MVSDGRGYFLYNLFDTHIYKPCQMTTKTAFALGNFSLTQHGKRCANNMKCDIIRLSEAHRVGLVCFHFDMWCTIN